MKTITELHALAIERFNAGDMEEASAIFELLCEKDPSNPHYPYLLGSCFSARGRDGIAIPLLAYAATTGPTSEAFNNLGVSLRRAGHDEAAELAYQRAIQINPVDPEPQINLSGVYVNAGDPEKCIELSDKALQTEPGNPRALSHKALALLELGRWSEAWPLYENRKKLHTWHDRKFACYEWNGEQVKCLAIHGEQGIGDEILFMSYFNRVKAERVVVECEPRLIPLFERSFGAKCYPTGEALKAAEEPTAFIAMGSLPNIVGPLPDKRPYMVANPERVKHYRERLEALGPGPYIGVSWKGGTKQTHAHLRSPGIEPWLQLMKQPAQFVSLQYGEAGAGHQALGIPHWQEAISDLDELAALIKALDLVITVCNSTVHFAGAVGAECWVLTPSKPAWRYGLKGDSMPWYQNVRLFRQVDGWGAVFKQIGDALADFRTVPAAEQAAA